MKNFGRKKEGQNKKESVFTRETLGVVLMLFSTLCLVCLIAGGKIFSAPGAWVSGFLYGAFGYFAYVFCALGLVYGFVLVSGKKLKTTVKMKLEIAFVLVALALLLHAITMHGVNANITYGEYLKTSYLKGVEGITASTGGGVVTGVVAYLVFRLLTPIGSYILLGVLFAVSVYLLVMDIVKTTRGKVQPEEHRSSFVKPKEESVVTDYTVSGTRDYPVESAVTPASANAGTQRLFVANPDFALKTKKDYKTETGEGIKIGEVGGMNIGVKPVAPAPVQKQEVQPTVQPSSYQEKLAYIRTPAEIKIEGYEEKPVEQETTVSTPIVESVVEPEQTVSEETPLVIDIPYIEHDETGDIDSAEAHAQDFGSRYAEVEEFDVLSNEPAPAQSSNSQFEYEEEIFPVEEEIVAEEISAKDILGMINEGETLISKEEEISQIERTPRTSERRSILPIEPVEEPTPEPAPVSEPETEPEEKPFIFKPYVRPPLDLLASYEQPVDAPKEDHASKMAIIEETLHQFKIEATVERYVQGPTLTRYELSMPSGKSVKEVGKYDDDLKMRLRSENGIRIEAPIPGLDRVGVEVENDIKQTVGLRATIEGMAKKPMKPGELRFAIGQDLLGNAIFDNLAAGPHYLVAGSTGSGKSVCLHAMIISLIMTYGPEDLRIILINPKVVEFGIYENLPHLLINEVLDNAAKTNAALAWAYGEMERRGKLFMEHSDVVVDIDGYNKYIANGKDVPKLPRIVIIIDEYADLVSDSRGDSSYKEVSSKVAAIAQKSRSAGIHLVLATQRPTTNIVTGTIKTNLPSRIALKLTNTTDSMTILDEPGAEKLLGHGDMLYRNSTMSCCKRYQGAYLDRIEMKNVVAFIKENNETHFDEKLTQMVYLAGQPKEEVSPVSVSAGDDNERGIEHDETFLKCLALGVKSGTMSISSLIRRFPIGYNKAAKIFDKIEALGYVSANEGSKARKMLLTKEEFEAKYGPLSNYEI